MSQTPLPPLYDRDFHLWIEETVAQLKLRNLENLDWDNLIEEIDSLGRQERREVYQRVRVILIHLLQRCYVNSPPDFRNWEVIIREQRDQLELVLADSPSLESIWPEKFADAWEDAIALVRLAYPDTEFPVTNPFPPEIPAILTHSFWAD